MCTQTSHTTRSLRLLLSIIFPHPAPKPNALLITRENLKLKQLTTSRCFEQSKGPVRVSCFLLLNKFSKSPFSHVSGSGPRVKLIDAIRVLCFYKVGLSVCSFRPTANMNIH